jgi:hypothetical protein
MYPERVRAEARTMLAAGHSLSEVSRHLAIARSTLGAWRDAGPERPGPANACPRCDGTGLDGPAYAALLGYYLGDGCLSAAPRYFALRVSCDAAWPGVVADVAAAIRGVRPRANVFEVPAPGVLVVTASWKHWPCLFPQHGPGRKHERPIVLEEWQSAIVAAYPAELLRGLFHSDGSRVHNWATRIVAGERRRYEYPRWQFVNSSADIRGLCCAALDLVEVGWRRSSWKTISVSRRADVARLDGLIGPKR